MFDNLGKDTLKLTHWLAIMRYIIGNFLQRHGSPRYCCSFCSPVPEVYATGFLGFTERDSLSSTPDCLVWLYTPGSHFPWLVCYICALFSLCLCRLLFPCPLVMRVPMRWCSCYAACFIYIVCYRYRPVSVNEVNPRSFVWGTAQCFCIRASFGCIEKPYCVFLRLPPKSFIPAWQ